VEMETLCDQFLRRLYRDNSNESSAGKKTEEKTSPAAVPHLPREAASKVQGDETKSARKETRQAAK